MHITLTTPFGYRVGGLPGDGLSALHEMPPWLAMITDELKQGKQAVNCLGFGEPQLRVFDQRDPCHRDSNDMLNSVKRAGLDCTGLRI
mgnify:CR=1 FL=1